jgi:CRP-like cAMP-binding protein
MGDVDAMSALEVFADVPRRDLHELAVLAPPTRFPAGAALFSEGEEAQMALLILEGRVEASIGDGARARVVGQAGPGEIIGEQGLLGGSARRNATVRAVEPCACVILSADVLRRARDNEALVALEGRLLTTLASRIRHSNAVVQDAWRDSVATVGGKGSIRDRLRSLWGRR